MNIPSTRQFLAPVGSLLLLVMGMPAVVFANDNGLSGQQLMEKVYERHQQFPYVYEEQSMVLEDRRGKRDTRRAKRYTRLGADGSIKFLLLFEYPEDIRGVAVLAERDAQGRIDKRIYLPALGETMLDSAGDATSTSFLGTDFTVESLTGEDLSAYRYQRREDQLLDGIAYHVVDVFPLEKKKYALRRHYIRKDNLYITLTRHLDRQGRVSHVQSHHDLRAVDGDMWRADMILMVDKKEQHQSLIKISKRIFSSDYVPSEVFTETWLYENYPYEEPAVEEEYEAISLLREAMSP